MTSPHLQNLDIGADSNYHSDSGEKATSPYQTVIFYINHFIRVCTARCVTEARAISSNLSTNWKILAFGQGLSLCLAASGAASSELYVSCNISAPSNQFGLMYIMLAFHLYPVVVRNSKLARSQTVDRDDEQFRTQHSDNSCDENIISELPHTFLGIPMKGPIILYFLMAVLDVEANVFTMLSFSYTSLTSVTLLDSLAIPGAMIASRTLLKSRYKPTHLIAASICIAGVLLNVFSDYREEEHAEAAGLDVLYPREVYGDVLAAMGGILYGVNDAIAELLVKQFDPQEYVGFTGFFGMLVSIIQALVFDRDTIREIFNGSSSCGGTSIAVIFSVFTIVSYLSFIGISRFLIVSEAAFLNLSLLTGDFYAVLFSMIGEHIIPQPLFFVAMLMILFGVIMYELAPSPIAPSVELGESSLHLQTNTEMEIN